MKIADQLLVEMSRKNVDYIAYCIGEDPELFRELLDLVFEGKHPIPLRASWVVSAVTDKYPVLMKPYVKKVIHHIPQFIHPGIRRNLLRHIATIEIPKSLEGKLYEECYQWTVSRLEPPANKVHCMQIMFNIAEKEPDLKNELRLVLEEMIHHESAAIKSRSRQLIKKL
jgi:hypothetical protein